ncbi:MAG TPA: hypothetical protein VFF73_33020 [Planctomycetota bacterium]|nr:hypothetical protein [Planctomycetota bacterium]
MRRLPCVLVLFFLSGCVDLSPAVSRAHTSATDPVAPTPAPTPAPRGTEPQQVADTEEPIVIEIRGTKAGARADEDDAHARRDAQDTADHRKWIEQLEASARASQGRPVRSPIPRSSWLAPRPTANVPAPLPRAPRSPAPRAQQRGADDQQAPSQAPLPQFDPSPSPAPEAPSPTPPPPPDTTTVDAELATQWGLLRQQEAAGDPGAAGTRATIQSFEAKKQRILAGSGE